MVAKGSGGNFECQGFASILKLLKVLAHSTRARTRSPKVAESESESESLAASMTSQASRLISNTNAAYPFEQLCVMEDESSMMNPPGP